MTSHSPASQLFSVTRGGFHAAGYDRERGEVIDASDWRNVQPLVNQRYLSPVYAGGERGFVATDDGRVWVDEDAADSHKLRMADGVEGYVPVNPSPEPDPKPLTASTSTSIPTSSSTPASPPKRKYTKRSAA